MHTLNRVRHPRVLGTYMGRQQAAVNILEPLRIFRWRHVEVAAEHTSIASQEILHFQAIERRH